MLFEVSLVLKGVKIAPVKKLWSNYTYHAQLTGKMTPLRHKPSAIRASVSQNTLSSTDLRDYCIWDIRSFKNYLYKENRGGESSAVYFDISGGFEISYVRDTDIYLYLFTVDNFKHRLYITLFSHCIFLKGYMCLSS